MRDLHAIVYVSKATIPFDADQLEELAAHSLVANQERDITGFLYYEEHYFLQYLEGPADQVQKLMQKIQVDARHQVKQVKEKPTLNHRRFPDWHMHRLYKSSLIEIRMEHLLLEYMLMMQKDFIMLSQRANNSIWKIVDKVSRLQTSFL